MKNIIWGVCLVVGLFVLLAPAYSAYDRYKFCNMPGATEFVYFGSAVPTGEVALRCPHGGEYTYIQPDNKTIFRCYKGQKHWVAVWPEYREFEIAGSPEF